jgi:hypothetical protein
MDLPIVLGAENHARLVTHIEHIKRDLGAVLGKGNGAVPFLAAGTSPDVNPVLIYWTIDPLEEAVRKLSTPGFSWEWVGRDGDLHFEPWMSTR